MDGTASAGIAGTAESTVPERTHRQSPPGQNASPGSLNRDSYPSAQALFRGAGAPGSSHCAP